MADDGKRRFAERAAEHVVDLARSRVLNDETIGLWTLEEEAEVILTETIAEALLEAQAGRLPLKPRSLPNASEIPTKGGPTGR